MSITVGTDAAGLGTAAEAVRAGGVLVYPTETVYGLGADARDPAALARIRRLKGRDAAKPVLVLTDTWRRVADWSGELDAEVLRVMSHEPPLAVTLLVTAGAGAPTGVVGPEGLLGVRRTSDEFCRALIAAADAPLLSTSANSAGAPPPADIDEVEPALLAAVDVVVDAGRRLPGVASTVARIVDGRVEVVRDGAVDASTLARVASGRG